MEALQSINAIDPNLLWLHSIFEKNKNIPFVQRLQNRYVYPNIPWGNFIAPADYSKGSKLEGYVKITLKTIIQGIQFSQTQQDMVKYYIRGKHK